MENNNLVREHAINLLNIAIKNNELKYYISGIMGYNIYSKKMDANSDFPVSLIMESIYKVYVEKPNLLLDKKFSEAISEVFKNSKNGQSLMRVVSLIEYQLRQEKKGVAPFNIDSASLLKILSTNIKQNKKLYSQPISDLNLQRGFISEFENHNRTLESNYDHKIL